MPRTYLSTNFARSNHERMAVKALLEVSIYCYNVFLRLFMDFSFSKISNRNFAVPKCTQTTRRTIEVTKLAKECIVADTNCKNAKHRTTCA